MALGLSSKKASSRNVAVERRNLITVCRWAPLAGGGQGEASGRAAEIRTERARGRMHSSRGEKGGSAELRGACPLSLLVQTKRGFGGLVPTLLGQVRPMPSPGPGG